MSLFKKRRLGIAILVYWFLLAYIIAELVWWFIALETQTRQMANFKIQGLRLDDPAYETRLNNILQEVTRKTAGYIGEGAIFLLLIIIGALFVYREVRRQIKLQQQQQNFMMAVTHELKTPIAVAKLNLQTLLKHRLDEDRQHKIIQSSISELSRLDSLANNILIVSQLDGGGYIQSREDLDFSELTQRTVKEYKDRYTDRNWNLAIVPGIRLTGDPLLLQLLVSNLVENAVKYSPKESPIGVSLATEHDGTILAVADNGPGITTLEKKKIFRKFYRVGNEQTRNTKGTGLGLYLCSKIAEDHKATLKVSDNSPAGSIFTVIF